MAHPRFLIHSGAQISYSLITEQEREAVDAAIAPLLKRPEKQWPRLGAVKLKSAKPLYLLHVDDSLRAIVQPNAEGQPELLYLVRQELLDNYFREDGETVATP
jgi:hypothetical protein